MALRPFQESLAEHAAGTQRNFRLNNMITGTQRITFGIQKSQHAVLLIIMQKMPCERNGYQSADKNDDKFPNLHSDGKNIAAVVK